MSICEIKIGDYVEANRNIPKKNILKGQTGRVFSGQYIDSEFYLDIECKEKDGNEFFVYNSSDSCWNKVDKPNDEKYESVPEELVGSLIVEEKPVPHTYKVPEPDWVKIRELAIEHAETLHGIEDHDDCGYYEITNRGLKKFVMAVLELNKATDQNNLSDHIHPAWPGVSAVVTRYENKTVVIGGGGAGFSVDGVRTVFGSNHDLTQEPKNE